MKYMYIFLKISLVYEQELNLGILLKLKPLHDRCSGHPCTKG